MTKQDTNYFYADVSSMTILYTPIDQGVTTFDFIGQTNNPSIMMGASSLLKYHDNLPQSGWTVRHW